MAVSKIGNYLKFKTIKSGYLKDKFNKEKGREPTIEEISKKLEVDAIDVIMALEAIQEPISIYTPIYSSGGDEIYLMDQIASEEYDESKKINSLIIDEGIRKLNPRLKNIIYSRYFENKTQVEIADELGISQAQVSRLEKAALKAIINEK